MIAALHTHFLGLTQEERIIQYARTKRDKAVYRSHAIYTFEKFSTDLQEAFPLLVEYDTEVPQAEQIRLPREKIITDKVDFNTAVITALMDGHCLTFANAITRVSQYVSHFSPLGRHLRYAGAPSLPLMYPKLHKRNKEKNSFILECISPSSPA